MDADAAAERNRLQGVLDAIVRAVDEAVGSFAGDPSDTDFQRGYFEALGWMQKELLAHIGARARPPIAERETRRTIEALIIGGGKVAVVGRLLKVLHPVVEEVWNEEIKRAGRGGVPESVAIGNTLGALAIALGALAGGCAGGVGHDLSADERRQAVDGIVAAFRGGAHHNFTACVAPQKEPSHERTDRDR